MVSKRHLLWEIENLEIQIKYLAELYGAISNYLDIEFTRQPERLVAVKRKVKK
jgi:hypothetical protein